MKAGSSLANAAMNPATDLSSSDPADGIDHHTVRRAVGVLLRTPAFARAPRMCRLLGFLIDKKLGGKEHEISEYAICIEVFKRDARVYDTLLDPVVGGGQVVPVRPHR